MGRKLWGENRSNSRTCSCIGVEQCKVHLKRIRGAYERLDIKFPTEITMRAKTKAGREEGEQLHTA